MPKYGYSYDQESYVGAFATIGDASFERSQLAAFRKSCIDPGGSQLWLPFANDAPDVSGEKPGELRITPDDVERAKPIIERMARRRAASKS